MDEEVMEPPEKPAKKMGMDMALDMMPDFEYLSLDRDIWDEQVMFLSHNITGESATMTIPGDGSIDAEDIKLHRDENGFAFVDMQTDAESVWASDMLTFALYKSELGEELLLPCKTDGPRRAFHMSSLADFVQRLRLEFKVGHTRRSCVIDVDVLPLRRCGCRVYFSMASLHDALGIQKDSHRSTWVHKRFLGWCSSLAAVGLTGHLAKPAAEAFAKQRTKLNSAEDANTCELLSKPGIDGVGLIYLLMQWAYRPRAKGGFSDDKDKAAAKELLMGLISSMHFEQWPLQLALSEHERWCPPRPLTGAAPLVIEVSPRGDIELPELPSGLHVFEVKFFEEQLGWTPGAILSLTEFVDTVCGKSFCKQWQHLLIQMAIRLGSKLDGALCGFGDIFLERPPAGGFVWADNGSRSELQRNLKAMRYWHLGRQAAAEHASLPWSIVTDGTRAGGREMQNGAVIFPSNVAFQFPPLVAPDFEDEIELLEAAAIFDDGPSAADVEEQICEAKETWRAMSEQWMEKASGEVPKAKKRFRRASRDFLMNLDHQLRTATGMGGLLAWCPPEGGWPDDALAWPTLSVTSDQGPTLVCGLGWMQRVHNANIEITWDFSHGAWNDARIALKKSKLWPYFLTFLLSRNSRHGPWAETKRYQQCVEASQTLMKLVDKNSATMQDLLEKILRDKQEPMPYTKEQLDNEWNILCNGEAWRNKGSKVKLNRFFQGIREASAEDFFWHSRHIVQLYVALNSNMLTSKKVESYLQRKLDAQKIDLDGEQPGRERVQRSAEDDKMRKMTQNMLSLSTLFLDDTENQVTLRIIIMATRSCERFHGSSNQFLRSVEKSAPWLTDMVQNGFRTHILDAWSSLKSFKDLQYIGFEIPPRCGFSVHVGSNANSCMRDDERACLLGTLLGHLSFARCRRIAFLWRGWVGKSVLLLKEETRAPALAQLRADYEGYLKLQETVQETGIGADFVKRSCFQLASTMQLVKALEQRNWTCDGEFLLWLDRKHKRTLLSQIAEDQNHTARHLETKGMNGKATPRTVYSALIEEKVLAARHDYEEIDVDGEWSCALGNDKRLASEVFDVQGTQPSMNFNKIVGFNNKPSWYSPGVDSLHLGFCDLMVLEDPGVRADMSMLKEIAWTSTLLDGERLLVRKENSQRWFLVLGFVPGSATWGLPMLDHTTPGEDAKYLTVDHNSELVGIVVLRPEEWQAMTFDWRAPLWQSATWRHSRSWVAENPAIRAVPNCSPGPLLSICAENAFFELSKCSLKLIAQNTGVDIKGLERASLFDILTALLGKHLPDATDENISKALQRRLSMLDRTANLHAEALLEVNETWDLMDKDDEKAVKTEQKDLVDHKETYKTFVRAYAARERRLRESAITELAGKRKGGRARGAVVKQKPLPPTVLTQKEAAALMPDGASIWKVNATNGWAIDVPPLKRYSASAFKCGGEHAAMLHVLKIAWESHIMLNGLSASDCPIAGLVDPSPSVAADASGATGSGAQKRAAGAAASSAASSSGAACSATRPAKRWKQ